MSKSNNGILITLPISVRILIVFAGIVFLAILLLLYFGEYSQKQRVPGVLVSNKDATLEAEIYVPSNAIAHIKQGNSVQLKYRAFPYQKYDQHHGTVRRISEVPVQLLDINSSLASEMPRGISVYRVKVSLQSQNVLVYGKQESLRLGMELDAYITSSKKPLYKWIFKPLNVTR